jgi:hypothetical protein
MPKFLFGALADSFCAKAGRPGRWWALAGATVVAPHLFLMGRGHALCRVLRKVGKPTS